MRHKYQEGLVWNSHPGALLTLKPDFSDHLSDFPYNYGANEADQFRGCANKTTSKFTAVIYTQLTSASQTVHLSAPIFKLARNVAASSFVHQVNF